MKAGLLCSSVCGMVLLAVSGCDQSSQAGSSKAEAYIVKGDKLGMDLQEYQGKHPGICKEAPQSNAVRGDFVCPTPHTTYAGIKAERVDDFSHNKLFKISYTFNGADSDEMIAALKSKFGDPSKDDIGGASALIWRNGVSTIKYTPSQDSKQVVISFSLDSLQAETDASTEKQKMEMRKADM